MRTLLIGLLITMTSVFANSKNFELISPVPAKKAEKFKRLTLKFNYIHQDEVFLEDGIKIDELVIPAGEQVNIVSDFGYDCGIQIEYKKELLVIYAEKRKFQSSKGTEEYCGDLPEEFAYKKY